MYLENLMVPTNKTGGRSVSRGQKNGNESLMSDLRSITGSRRNNSITNEYSGPRKLTTQVMEAVAIVANFWAAGVILRGKSATYQTEGSETASGIPRQKHERT